MLMKTFSSSKHHIGQRQNHTVTSPSSSHSSTHHTEREVLSNAVNAHDDLPTIRLVLDLDLNGVYEHVSNAVSRRQKS
jgi:hypothetical protein